MFSRSSFVKLVALVAVIALVVLGSYSAEAVASLQATAAPTNGSGGTTPTAATTGATTAATTGATVAATTGATTAATTGATVAATTASSNSSSSTGNTAATTAATMAATFDAGAFPPCPVVVRPTMEATMGAMESTMASTMSGASTGAMATAEGTETMGATDEANMESTDEYATEAAGMESTEMATAEMMTPAATTAATLESTMQVGTFAQNPGCQFTATLAGKNEVPKAGDPNAKGTAKISISRSETGLGQVCFEVNITGLKVPATAAHIHWGKEGVAGPIVVPFAAPDAQGVARGCTSNVNRALVRQIVTTPWDFYVNVHNADFPAGAARGQLEPVTK